MGVVRSQKFLCVRSIYGNNIKAYRWGVAYMVILCYMIMLCMLKYCGYNHDVLDIPKHRMP